ncbi:MAG: hypothetical protein RBS08_00605 [Bdellovibrionales bacterium]|jgi:hypothetical protein|nr:hypothetical protein [Bdellovibrionales bacterium]
MSKKIGLCLYCNETKKLCDAHIVPRGFLGDVVDKAYLEISSEDDRKKRSRIGPYDRGILCADCDRKIGVYDEYAKRFLVNEIDAYRQGINPLYVIPADTLNYEFFKKFFISLLWRASVSSHPIFQHVSLGAYEAIAIKMIKGELDLDDKKFSVLVFKDAPSLKYADVISCVRSRLAKVWAYKFHFAGYQFSIVPNSVYMCWEIDNNLFSPELFFLKEKQNFVVLEVDQDVSGKEILLARKRQFMLKVV